jgi:tRNA U34 5-carboxymethylaminomethyl modifying enzyme MnmG/GidA
MLVQLIYISTIVGITIDQIENYIDRARIRNLATGLAGIVMITDKNYIHYIEGERCDVSDKYNEMISFNHLHTKCTILRFNEISKREFPDFVAEYAKLSDISKEELSKLPAAEPAVITAASAMSYIRRVAAHHRADFKDKK